jgi:hypothetical protein
MTRVLRVQVMPIVVLAVDPLEALVASDARDLYRPACSK